MKKEVHKKVEMSRRLEHPIEPIFDERSRVLILGSFPSIRSREENFFYGHPQNRFWRVLANVSGAQVPVSVEEKKAFLRTNGIALWDVIASCEIVGSSDNSIRNVIPNDVMRILQSADIKAIFVNGATAEKLYHKYLQEKTGREAIRLPSTSPANAAWSIKRLCAAWKCVGDMLGK